MGKNRGQHSGHEGRYSSFGGRAFAQLAAGSLLPRSLRPRIHAEVPRGVFPPPVHLSSETGDPVLERIYVKAFSRWA